MSKKSISEKAVFYACLAEVAEDVKRNMEYHEEKATELFEYAYNDNGVADTYYEPEYKQQLAKKNAFAEILEALNKF